MQIEFVDIDQLIPYQNNPRHNDGAVAEVAKSISEYGFNVPLVIDQYGVVIAGHTRLKAARDLGIKDIPVYRVNLTEEQAKAYRIADNKAAQYAEWDFDALRAELEALDANGFDL